jgi:hypothetical protein
MHKFIALVETGRFRWKRKLSTLVELSTWRGSYTFCCYCFDKKTSESHNSPNYEQFIV